MSGSLNQPLPLPQNHACPKENFVLNSNVDKPCQMAAENNYQVYQDHSYQANNPYFQISSNISPTSPSFHQAYPTPTRGQSYYSYPPVNDLVSNVRSSTEAPSTSYPQFYHSTQPTGMASLMSNRPIPTSLNLSNVGLRTDNINSPHYPSSYTPYHPYSFQPNLRRNLDSSFLPSPAMRNPGYQRSGFVPLPMMNNHMPNGLPAHPNMMSPLNTPMSGNDQIAFLSQNPQYLSGLAGQALGSSGKISRAIAAQLFARDEHTDRFPCTLCGQSFKRINGLKRHLMMHLHIKPYKCDMCGRGFCRIDVYKRHVNRAKCNKESH